MEITDKMVEAFIAAIKDDGNNAFVVREGETILIDGYIYIKQALAAALNESEPVAWRVKDFADGWILCHSFEEATREAAGAGNMIQPLYT